MIARLRAGALTALTALTGLAALAFTWGLCPTGAQAEDATAPFVVVLGIAQDAGHPQTGCVKACCAAGFEDPAQGHWVSCIALVTDENRYVFDATPDFPKQLRWLDAHCPVRRDGGNRDPGLAGIFLTHAHIGHYTGLMHLGRESMGASGVRIYAMPRLAAYLRDNGPWGQLVQLENIQIEPIQHRRRIELAPGISVQPLSVPHRDEYSETVGYRIAGPKASVLFIPDIDKWEKWETPLVEALAEVDRAYLDGTFYADGEIAGRAMAELPHPFIEETLALVASLPASERAKLHFIHLNHTNPALDAAGAAVARIRTAGCEVARRGDRFGI